MSGLEDASGAAGLPARPSVLRRWRWVLIAAGPLLVAAGVAAYILTGGRYQTTDDAYVQIEKAPVAASIAGRVTEVFVHENQVVRRGQPLFRLDARENQANLQAAAAEVANAKLTVAGLRAAYRQQAASLGAARETLAFDQREAVRMRKLTAIGVASQQQADQAAHAVEVARAQVATTEQSVAQSLAALGGDPNLAAEAAPSVMLTQARLDRARLNVSYATVTAPADGIVARVQQLPVGTYLNASQTAFWLLSGRPWVEANFKEDQLANMRAGQVAEIDIDARPKGALRGRVVSFAPGTGGAFSALPAQNATGNWVKVTQRLPVRIEFDRVPEGLAAGLSAKIKVDVKGAREKAPDAAGK